MTKRTPTVGTKGRFSLISPFVVPPTNSYVCKAVRSIKDLYRDNVDVFGVYYEPVGLSREDLRADEALDANIVTIVSRTDTHLDVIYVPDTYIESFPNMDNINYNRVVFSIDFGILPDYIDLSAVESMIKSEGAAIIGTEPNVSKHIVEFNGYISNDEHDQLEISRLSNIQGSITERAKRMRAEQREADLRAQIATLEQIIIDAGLID